MIRRVPLFVLIKERCSFFRISFQKGIESGYDELADISEINLRGSEGTYIVILSGLACATHEVLKQW